MCLIAFAIGSHPECPLLVASNRDEFFERPTAPLHPWTTPCGNATVWAGRDLRDGGTWLGFADNGRVAMLTNVRSARNATGQRSRGELPIRWLAGRLSLEQLTGQIEPSSYGGFNLVVGDIRSGQWAWFSNRPPEAPHGETASARLHCRALTPGVYGLSNAALDTPWPKTLRLKRALQRALTGPDGEEAALARLTTALADATHALPNEQPDTGVPADMERGLSSPFVDMPERGYGTRSSLVARVRPVTGSSRQLQLSEWTHPAPIGAQRHRWTAQPPRTQQISWV